MSLCEGGILSLDPFPSLIHLESQDYFRIDIILSAFQNPHLTPFLLRDRDENLGENDYTDDVHDFFPGFEKHID